MAVGMTAALAVRPQSRGGGKTPYVLALGDRLYEARIEAGLTPAQAEEKSGAQWTAVAIASYERGDRRISPERLVELAAFYEADAGWLLTGEVPVTADGPELLAAFGAWLASQPRPSLARLGRRVIRERRAAA
jgi:transcriptional regulator with XRE-family HTH domain